MKRIAVGLMAAGSMMFAGGMVADAYPPLAPAVSVDDPAPDPGAEINVTVTGCIVGERVDFALEGSTSSDTCEGGVGTASLVLAVATGGTATGVVDAPGAPGAYTGTATLIESDAILPFNIVVQAETGGPTSPTTTVAPILPSTGSDSSALTTVAFGLLLAGAGLFGVAQLRRRRLPA